jgi:hypothetical protein
MALPAASCAVSQEAERHFGTQIREENGRIMQAATDGTGGSAFSEVGDEPCDVAIDGNYVYWVDQHAQAIMRLPKLSEAGGTGRSGDTALLQLLMSG